MTVLHALILSVVEGITEYLPVSSTGHLILASKLLGVIQTDFAKTFEIVIQAGAILAIVVLYWQTLRSNINLWKKILAAFLPTSVVGLVLYRFIKDVLLGNSVVTVAALAAGGIILILLELFYKERDHHVDSVEHISYKQAVLIGLAQSISVIPGVSRSAATIIGGLFVGIKRNTAVEFSFLLAVPTLAAAGALDLVKSNLAFSPEEILLILIGLIGAFITAILTVKLFTSYVKKHTFIPFGIYRVATAAAFWFFVLRT